MSMGKDSMLDAYLYETDGLLEQLDSIVLAAEQADAFSNDDINTIFRIMHTIKGSSAMMEFNSLMTIAHRAEDLFAILREQSISIVPESLRPELFDLLFQTIDFFRQEIEHIQNGEALTDNIDTLLEKINSFIAQINGTAPAAAKEPDSSNSSESAADATPHGFPYGQRMPHRMDFPMVCGYFSTRAAVWKICGLLCS